jgi:uncharacterized protein YkuJ
MRIGFVSITTRLSTLATSLISRHRRYERSGTKVP